MTVALPARVEKHAPHPSVATFYNVFTRPMLLALSDDELARAGQDYHVINAAVMLVLLIDDPEHRARVLEEITRTVRKSQN
jgi:hypothetical protein